jgi:hypothetical protein
MEFSYGGEPPIPASKSNALRCIQNAPSYISNHRIYEGLQMTTVLTEIKSGVQNT